MAAPKPARRSATMPKFTTAWIALFMFVLAGILELAHQTIAGLVFVGVGGAVLIWMCVAEVRAFRELQSRGDGGFREPPESGGHRSTSTHVPM